MNTRQLTQGLLPTLEYEREHTYRSFRQFPDLRKSIEEIDEIQFKSGNPSNSLKKSKSLPRTIVHTSTHMLSTLSKSSLHESTFVMDNFRRILIDNRRRNQLGILPPADDEESDTASAIAADGHGQEGSSALQRAGGSIINHHTGTTATASAAISPKSRQRYLTMTPLERANDKLKKVAISFDSGGTNSHLQGFSGAKLTKEEFATLLRRCINISLTSPELIGLFAKMDEDGSGLIDGVEFVRYFFHLGNLAKAQMSMETKSRNEKRIEKLKKEHVKEIEKIKEWEAAQIGRKFSLEIDGQSAYEKLKKAAFVYNPCKEIDNLYVKKFQSYLTPYEFKQQIRKTFEIHFTGPEIAAMIYKYSTINKQQQNGSGESNGREGLRQSFSSVQQQPAQQQQAQQMLLQRQLFQGEREDEQGIEGKEGGREEEGEDDKHHDIGYHQAAKEEEERERIACGIPSSIIVGGEGGASSSSNQMTKKKGGRKPSTPSMRKDDRCVDGYTFVTDFIHLQKQAWLEHEQEMNIFRARKMKVNSMGQHVDILSQVLGR